MTTAALLAALAAGAGCWGAGVLAADLGSGSLLRRVPALPAIAGRGRPGRNSFAVAGALSAAIVVRGAPFRIVALGVVVAAAAGFVTPGAWEARRSKLRIESALHQLPDMLDLLRVALEAGAPPMHALGAVAAEFEGPLAREWRRACSQVELGVSQDEALEGLAHRLPHDEITSFVETLRRARRHGTPLARACAAQATRARHAQAQRVRERAARAGPKIQLVVALVLVPSVLLLLAAGLLAELERSGLALPG
jgi:tight adherence protein C